MLSLLIPVFTLTFLPSLSQSQPVEMDSSKLPCDCKQVKEWQDLKNHIQQIQDMMNSDGNRKRPFLLLCPFDINIEKTDETIEITQPIHLQCKRSEEEQCIMRGQGLACSKYANCNKWMKISADDVWLQGMIFMGSPNDVVQIDPALQGIKLIDMDFIGNSSPLRSAGSIVAVKDGTSVQIIGSHFMNNFGTALENRGTTYILNSTFTNNHATPFYISNDVLASVRLYPKY